MSTCICLLYAIGLLMLNFLSLSAYLLYAIGLRYLCSIFCLEVLKTDTGIAALPAAVLEMAAAAAAAAALEPADSLEVPPPRGLSSDCTRRPTLVSTSSDYEIVDLSSDSILDESCNVLSKKKQRLDVAGGQPPVKKRTMKIRRSGQEKAEEVIRNEASRLQRLKGKISRIANAWAQLPIPKRVAGPGQMWVLGAHLSKEVGRTSV